MFLPGRHDAAVPLAIGDVPHHRVPVRVQDEGASTHPQHAAQLRQGRRDVGDVLVDLGRHRGIESAVGVRQRQGVALVDADPGSAGRHVAGDGVHRRALVESVDGAAGPDGVGQGRHEEAGPGADVEHALSRLGGEEGENLGALLDDVRRGVDALDVAGSVVVELEHRHVGLLRRGTHLAWSLMMADPTGCSGDAGAALRPRRRPRANPPAGRGAGHTRRLQASRVGCAAHAIKTPR